jgi:hypothetical protein
LNEAKEYQVHTNSTADLLGIQFHIGATIFVIKDTGQMFLADGPLLLRAEGMWVQNKMNV